MAVRPIDADALLNEAEYDSNFRLIIPADKVKTAPTLTPPNEWVSVEERLPEDDVPAGRKQITVLVATKAGKVTIASRVFEPEREYCGKVYPTRWLWSRWLNNHVTHWMPLPASPTKKRG